MKARLDASIVAARIHPAFVGATSAFDETAPRSVLVMEMREVRHDGNRQRIAYCYARALRIPFVQRQTKEAKARDVTIVRDQRAMLWD
jgi:hypothetical protein